MTSIGSKWRASRLEPYFNRTIVGFDLRKGSSLNKLFMTSYDDSVRYEDLNEEHRDQMSGINLFYCDPSAQPLFTIPYDARIVAFDLPTTLVSCLLNGQVSVPFPLPSEKLDQDWQFVGFDVVDAITQTSAFYGFDRSTSDLGHLAEIFSIRFNSCGLIDDMEAAVRAATSFDDAIPEHAPFAPCGTWLKISSLE